MLKVLHISISDNLGGAAIAARRLHNEMNKGTDFLSRMLVLVRCSEDLGVSQVNRLQNLSARIVNKIEYTFLPRPKYNGSFSWSILGLDLSNNQLVLDSDIIYIHWVNSGMFSIDSIAKLAQLGKPIILYAHDMWYFTGGCHQSNGCEEFSANCTNCPLFDSITVKSAVKALRRKKRDLFNHYPNIRLVLPSSVFFNKGVNSMITEQDRVHQIPNVLDLSFWRPNEIINYVKKTVVLYGAIGGRTNPYKGWDDFEYFACQLKKCYGKSVEIQVFGNDFNCEELQRMPFIDVSHGLIIDEKSMCEVYKEADIFLFPSSQESFGQTLIEAMSCGLVPISYDVGIASDVIVNGFNGYILNTGDKKGLVNAFNDLMTKDLNPLKMRARQTIEVELSNVKILRKHHTLIEKLL